MRSLIIPALFTLAALSTKAQYGAFNAKAVTAAKITTTLVVLDDGDSPYNRAIMNAMKAHWTFTPSYDFIHVRDLALQPVTVDKTYLLKTLKSDPEKHDGIFLTLAMGWKQKKDAALRTRENEVTNLPAEQELAFLLIDPNAMAANNTTAMVNLYVKHLQDYLQQVEKGKIIDKATADRLYQGRNRHVRDEMELWIAKEHLDKSLPDVPSVKANYTHAVQIKDQGGLMTAVEKQSSGVAITDVVFTGDHKERWCFKRVFNTNTGELMYLSDDASLFGKKAGFIDEDLKQIERSR